jgi:hypothetical protein
MPVILCPVKTRTQYPAGISIILWEPKKGGQHETSPIPLRKQEEEVY